MLLIDDRLEMNTKTHLLLQEDDSSEKESRNYNRGVFRAVAWLAQSIKTFLGPHLQLRTRWPLTLTITTLVYGAGLAFGIVISQYMQIAYSTPHSISYSPARSAISYERQSKHATDHSVHSIYSGFPTHNQTKAWEDLLSPVMIRASYEEMALAGEDPDNSVQLDSGGYLASLGVYHDLHCLRRIRLFVYKDVYYPNITSQQYITEERHIDHCLESLRLSTMCTGEIGLYTFGWKPDVIKPATKSSAARKCINWDALKRWTKDRSVGFNPVLVTRLETMKRL